MEEVPGREDQCGYGGSLEASDALSARQSPVLIGGAGTAVLSVSREVYSLKAVLAAAYKVSGKFAVLIDSDGPDRWGLFVVGRETDDAIALAQILSKELGDQALREQLENEFGALRTLIVAQAFSEGNLLDPTRDADDFVSDARGVSERR